MMPKLVTTIEEAKHNVLSFFDDPEGYGGHLWNHPAKVKAWYAVRTPDGWAFGPSRIVGHERDDLQAYLRNMEERHEDGDFADGGRTEKEKALQAFSEPLSRKDPLYKEVMSQLKVWLLEHDARPNESARVTLLGEASVSSSGLRSRSSEEKYRERLIKEGQVEEQILKRRYRDTTTRQACIEAHGLSCSVCKMDFGKIFGSEFHGLIEVHHCTPLAAADRDGFAISPKKDCLPLCPNCHAMAHFGLERGACRSVEDLKAIRNRARRDSGR